MKSRRRSQPGVREQNKLEKRQRIRAAVRDLFSRHGYETATLRQIAKRAHVGLGTLFNYAQDKRDLVFLVFNEELDAVTDEALTAARAPVQLPDRLIGLCKAHYTFFAKNPPLSRILLKELTFYSEGKQAAEFHRIRARLLAGIEELVRSAQRAGQIRSDEDARLIARHIFLVFAGALRWWIAGPHPDSRKGLAELRRLFALQIGGIVSHPSKRAGRSKRSRDVRRSR